MRKAIAALEKGGIVLVISHSETLLPFADKLVRSLRGDDVLVETRTLRDRRDWKRLLPAADLVLADALSVEAVRRVRTRGVVPFRILGARPSIDWPGRLAPPWPPGGGFLPAKAPGRPAAGPVGPDSLAPPSPVERPGARIRVARSGAHGRTNSGVPPRGAGIGFDVAAASLPAWPRPPAWALSCTAAAVTAAPIP